MKTPLVSIIIPTLNRAHLIGETLESVLAQTYHHWECIVVDDGSTDGTDKVLAHYMAKDPRFQYHHRPKDRLAGGNAARNYGLEVSKGEYIQWFDSDDLMLEKYLEKRMTLFHTQQGGDVVFCAFTYFNENGFQKRISNKSFSGNIIEDFINEKVFFGPQAYLLRKEILENFKFDEALKRAQDADFFFRLFTQSNDLKIYHTSEVLYWIRKHYNAISTSEDPYGLKLNSRYIVHKRFLRYFHNAQHQKGIFKYKTECLHDLKRLLNNKNYKRVAYNIINFEFLNFRQKAYFLFCVFTEFSVGRGANQFKEPL
jgi:glycosyltransferase involved in cell wall biosynthesis